MIHTIHLDRILREAVATPYRDLVTRPTGAAVRNGVVDAMATAHCVIAVLDFSDVGLLDFSCADEVVAKLLMVVSSDHYVLLTGLSDDHSEAIDHVLRRHDLAVVALPRAGRVPFLLGPASAEAHDRLPADPGAAGPAPCPAWRARWAGASPGRRARSTNCRPAGWCGRTRARITRSPSNDPAIASASPPPPSMASPTAGRTGLRSCPRWCRAAPSPIRWDRTRRCCTPATATTRTRSSWRRSTPCWRARRRAVPLQRHGGDRPGPPGRPPPGRPPRLQRLDLRRHPAAVR